MNKIIIVAKGSSLLNSRNGNQIDNFDVIIRTNHLPDNSNEIYLGKRTDIFCCRSNDKILKFKDRLHNVKYWHAHPYNILDSKTKEILKSINDVEYINEEDSKLISENFKLNFIKNYTKSKNDISFGMSYPDTGVTSIIMTLTRFKESEIYITGFDNYKEKNKNIYEMKSDVSIFKTPVLSQEIFLRKMISNQTIKLLE